MNAPVAVTVADMKSGRRDAIAALFAQNRGRLLAVAARMVSPGDVEDVVQDAFVSALRHCDRFRGEAAPATWLYRVTVNEALMRLRRQRRRPAESLDALLLQDGDGALPPRTDDQLVSPEEAQVNRELRAILDEALATLRPLDARIVRARLADDDTTDEVAARERITVDAARTRLHRARASLQARLYEPLART